MPRSTVLSAAGRQCVRAVKAYAAELAEATALRARVTAAAGSRDVEFDDGGPQTTPLRVEWSCRRPGRTSGRAHYEDEDPAGDDGADQEHAIAHYARTLEALARNLEAARSFLKSR